MDNQHTSPTAGPCPICGTHANPVRAHLAKEHPVGDWGPYSGRHINAQDDDTAIGAGRAATYVLGIWPADTISRATLSALVKTAVPDRPTTRIARSLQTLERDGIARRDGENVRILDQAAAYRCAVASIENPRHDTFLALAAAVPVIEEQIRREKRAEVIEHRERELCHIRSLMGGPYGGGLPGNGSARRVIAAGRAG